MLFHPSVCPSILPVSSCSIKDLGFGGVLGLRKNGNLDTSSLTFTSAESSLISSTGITSRSMKVCNENNSES